MTPEQLTIIEKCAIAVGKRIGINGVGTLFDFEQAIPYNPITNGGQLVELIALGVQITWGSEMECCGAFYKDNVGGELTADHPTRREALAWAVMRAVAASVE